jgi:hypothetical protein
LRVRGSIHYTPLDWFLLNRAVTLTPLLKAFVAPHTLIPSFVTNIFLVALPLQQDVGYYGDSVAIQVS